MVTKSEQKLTCGNCKKDEMVPCDLVPDLSEPNAFYVCTECNEPDWDHECDICGQSPIHKLTGMCGPCTFGEADTMHGNW